MWTALKQFYPLGARPAQRLASVQILNMFTNRCRLFTPKTMCPPCKHSLLSHPHFDLFSFVWIDFIIVPWWILLFFFFKSILTYTGNREKYALPWPHFGMCPRIKNVPQLNFYVKTTLCQFSFSKKFSALVEFLCFPSLYGIATNFFTWYEVHCFIPNSGNTRH